MSTLLSVSGVSKHFEVNGRTVKPAFDAELGCPVIEIPSTDIRKEVKIEIFG